MMSSSWSTLLLISVLICGASYTKSPVTYQSYARESSIYENKKFECVVYDGPPIIQFYCDDLQNCVMDFSNWKHNEMIPNLDAFTDNCTNSSTRLLSGKPGVSQAVIKQLIFTDLPHVPPNYFCKLTSTTRITLRSSVLTNSRHLGFNAGCNSQYANCCACNVKHLHLEIKGLQVISNASFCGFPRLETLDLLGNATTEIDSNAFITLTGLQNLKISMNELKMLSTSVFWPLTNLVSLNLEDNGLNEEVFLALQNMTLLKVLHLSFNKIADIGSETIQSDLTSLIELHLRENHLTSLRADFSHLQNLEKIDVSFNQIRDIAKGVFDPLQQLREVDLSWNQLVSLPDHLFSKNVHLMKLSLTSNQLTSIPHSVFTCLETLILNSNDIGNITVLDKENLCQLVNLKYLDLSKNKIQAIARHAFECNVSRQNEPGLKFINLSSNQLSSFSFADFSVNLVELHMSSNKIQEFPANLDVFHRPMSLKNLSLNNNLLTNLTYVALPPNLETLDLSENAITVASFAKIVSGEYMNLKLVNLNDNKLEIVCPLYFLGNVHVKLLMKRNPLHCECERQFFPKYIFEDSHSCPKALKSLNSKSTVHLVNDLDTIHQFSCSVSPSAPTCQCNSHSSYSALCNLSCPESCTCYIDHSFKKYLINCSDRNLHLVQQLPMPERLLLVLNFSTNHLRMLNSSNFTSYPLIIELHMNKNDLMEISYDALHNLTNLQVLNLEDNLLDELPSSLLDGLTKLITLNVANNMLDRISNDMFKSVMNLEVLNLENNQLKELPSGLLVGLRKLTTLNLANNELDRISNDAFKSLINLEVLNLEDNLLKELPLGLLAGLTKLTTLDLANNELDRISNDAFKSVINLKVLILEHNLLKELPSGLLAVLTKLTELYLAYNHLVNISGDIFQSLTVLVKLELQGNYLTYFSVWKLVNLTDLADLKLHHNPWSCECEFVWKFQKWLQAKSDIVDDQGNLYCKPKDHKVQSQFILSPNFSYCEVEQTSGSTSESVTYIWASVVAATILLITCLLILLFIYRREMQVIVYSRYGLRLFHQNQEADEGKVYDAFLAYSSDDTEFVVHNLIPGLEQIQRPYKLCIHERDFLVGDIITNSILAAVEQSRRTIVILSPNFVKSGFCVFEFKSAHFKMLSDRCSRIIVILLDDVPSNIDPEILLYLKTNTYLKWGDKLFWKRLYFALPDRTVAETTV